MISLLKPHLSVGSIFDLDIGILRKRGYRGLIMDLDNTLVAWNHPEAPQELLDWLAKVRHYGIDMCIVSNNLGRRVEEFAAQIGVSFIAKAAKPRRRAFRLAMRKMGTHRGDTAVVGDQVFTDILGGNRLKLFTILVRPVAAEEFWTTRLVRMVEHRMVRRHLAHHS
ncbi:MAG: YqeG family HAD IIIA-type phosphatase [Sulfobacillus sp.]